MANGRENLESRTLFTSQAACVAVCIIAFFLTVFVTCRHNALTMLAVLGTDGFSALLWIAGACALGAAVLNLLKIQSNPLLRIATAGGLGLGIFSLIGLLLGLAGWLNRPIALSLPVGSMVLWVAVLLRRPGAAGSHVDLAPMRRWLLEPAGISWLWIIPVISLAMVCVCASMLPGVYWKPFDPAPYDVTSYHLQVPREWYEAGRIIPLHHNMFSYFPFNVEMQFLLLMHAMGGPWAGMYACQFTCSGYFALMVLGVAGACTESRIDSPGRKAGDRPVKNTAVIGGAFASVVPWAMMLAGVAYVESALMLYTALAIAWTLRAIASTKSPGCTSRAPFVKPLILAGVMAGLAAGVKFTAVPMLLLAAPAAVFVVMMVRRPPELAVRRLVIGCLVFFIAGSTVVSPWLMRNRAWTGNPVWPLAMNVFGRDHFSPAQVERFTIAHSPRDDQQSLTARFGVLWRDVVSHWQYGYALLPAGLIALAMRWRDRQTWVLLLTGATIFIVWIGFTHLLARFLVMLIPVAAIAIGRVRWGRGWPMGVAITIIAAGLGWMKFVPELMTQSAVPSDSLIGWVDLRFMFSSDVLDANQSQMQVGLVGDAQAFLYQIPMTRLHYSSVFDLPTDETDPVAAWVGKAAVGNPDYELVINTSEIERLHRTYRYTPALPAEWKPRLGETFFARGDKVGVAGNPALR